MPKWVEVNQKSIIGGELDPRALRRTDLEDYGKYLAKLRNAYVLPQGGVTKREGLKQVLNLSTVNRGINETEDFSIDLYGIENHDLSFNAEILIRRSSFVVHQPTNRLYIYQWISNSQFKYLAYNFTDRTRLPGEDKTFNIPSQYSLKTLHIAVDRLRASAFDGTTVWVVVNEASAVINLPDNVGDEVSNRGHILAFDFATETLDQTRSIDGDILFQDDETMDFNNLLFQSHNKIQVVDGFLYIQYLLHLQKINIATKTVVSHMRINVFGGLPLNSPASAFFVKDDLVYFIERTFQDVEYSLQGRAVSFPDGVEDVSKRFTVTDTDFNAIKTEAETLYIDDYIYVLTIYSRTIHVLYFESVPTVPITPQGDSPLKLWQFRFNTNDTAVLAIQDSYIHFIINGIAHSTLIIPDAQRPVFQNVTNLKIIIQGDVIIFLNNDRIGILKRDLSNNTIQWSWLDTDMLQNIPYYDGDSTSNSGSGTIRISATSGKIEGRFSSRPSGFVAGQIIEIDGAVGRCITASGNTALINMFSTIPVFDVDDAIAANRWSYRTGSKPAWSDTDGWPQAGAFHQNRLWLGGSKTYPVHIWGSVTGDYFNFEEGRKLADEMVETEITSTLSPIVDIYGEKVLHINTQDSEHTIGNPISSQAITPSNVFVQQQGSIGTKPDTRIYEVDNSLYFIQRYGESVRSLEYNREQGSYTGEILGLLNAHVIKNPVDFAVRKSTNSIEGNRLYIVNEDGTMAVGTIVKSFNIIGFSLIDTPLGNIRNVVTDEEKVYIVITDADNNHHIYILDNDTLTDGTTDFTMLIETLPPDFGFKTSQGKKIRISEVVLLLRDTLNATVNGKEINFREGSNPERIEPFTGVKKVKSLPGWRTDNSIRIESKTGGSFTLEALNYKVKVAKT